MNAAFAPTAVAAIDDETSEMFRPGAGNSLSDALRATPGTDLSTAVTSYIDGWPTALQAALQAAIHNNLTRDGRVPITFAWAPGYDYGLTIHDVVDTATSHGGMTVLFTSRYPSDPHPLGGLSSSA